MQRIDLADGSGAVAASIENLRGKQGSLAVHQYLKQIFDTLDAKAAEHGGCAQPPCAHPNIDRLLAIAPGGAPLNIEVIAANR